MLRVLAPIAVAAMLIGVIVTVIPSSTWRYGYRQVQREYARLFHKQPAYQNSSEVLLALAEPSINEIGERSNSSYALGHDDPVYEAVMEMNSGRYRAAQGILDDVLSDFSETDPRYAEIMDDVDYLNALCELGRGYRTKAYRQLKAISIEIKPVQNKKARSPISVTLLGISIEVKPVQQFTKVFLSSEYSTPYLSMYAIK